MVINGISTLVTALQTQDSLSTAQKKLNDAVTEQSTLRHADVGLTLGGNVSRNVNWRAKLSDTTNYLDANAQALSRADALQTTLDAARTTASSFLSTLSGSRNAANGQALTQQGSGFAIDALVGAANATYGGQYLLGGQNTDVAPLNAYKGGPAQSSFDNAFQSFFGFAKTDPAASTITAAQMNSFLQGPYEDLFQSSSWSANFSNATSNNLQSRIDDNQQVDLSANANDPAIQDLMRGMVAVQEAGNGKLNSTAYQALVDYSMGKVSNAIQGLGDTQARIGAAQQTVTQTNTKLSSMKDVLDGEIQRTEGVDPAEVATRVNNLTTQLEANYTVTGKLAKLSLLNYI
ncbi:MAG: flagellar hook-associated family protein [Aestuariivirga sp.]